MPTRSRNPRDQSGPATTAANGSAAPAQHPKHIPIIGIGASAGGLGALTQFLKHVPIRCGAAIVIVQHLDPARDSTLTELLQRGSAMPVCEISDGMAIMPDHVYVIPPDSELSLSHGILHLAKPKSAPARRLLINTFFTSLADDQQQRSIGVLLSGAGNDGTLGLMAIKERGGVTAVQDPAFAHFAAMPQSAIDVGVVDVMAPADQLAARILALVRQANRRPLVDLVTSDPDGAYLAQILALLKQQTDHDFSLYKKTTLYRRIERRMGLRHITKLTDYVAFMQGHANEGNLLFKELLICVTRFFRDEDVWDQLRDEILPGLIDSRPEGGTLRAWCPGCATGEEAYSLAMVFQEALARAKPKVALSLHIFATDLNGVAIDQARRGVYPASIANTVSPERLARFFVKSSHGYRVNEEIREMVVFAPHSLLADPPFTKLDLLSCRNLMIYLAPDVHETLIPRFHFALNPGGILLLGSSESVGSATNLFAPLPGCGQLYQRVNSPLPPTHIGISIGSIPLLPLAPTNQSALPMAANVIANLQALADRMLLQRYVPAAVLVTSTGDIVHISGKTGRYLEPAPGKANWNVLAMAREGLSAAMSEAFYDAQRHHATVTLTATQTGDDGEIRSVDITVQPLHEPVEARGMLMIVFADVTTPTSTPALSKSERSARQSDRLKAMEQALQATREELQVTREEMQTSREELTSTNEELQSTNEELTTSAEELRTMNEELVRARAAAESNLARYTDLFDSAPVGYVTIDRKCVITQANLIAADFLGLGRDQRVGGHLALFVIEADRSTFTTCIERAFSKLEAHLCEVALWRSATESRQVRISAWAAEDGRTCRVVVIDVSEIRAAEAALRESEVRFRTLADYAPVLIWMSDADNLCTHVNKTWLDFTGRTQEQEAGLGWTESVHPDDLTHAYSYCGLEFAARRAFHMEFRMRRHDGEFRWLLDTGIPRFAPDGRFLGYIGSCIDITERKQAEAALATSTEMLERTGAMAKIGGWQVDLRTGERRWSLEVFHIHEIDPPLIPEAESLINFYAPEAVPTIQACIREGIEHGTPWDIELPFNTAKGRHLWVRVQGTVVMEDGKGIQLHGTLQDITERKLLEDELRQAQKMEAIGRLAGGIAHDFNNQLTVIQGFASMALVKASDEAMNKCLNQIVNATERSAKLVQQLLTFSRKGRHKVAQVDMHHLLSELMEILGRSLNKLIRMQPALHASDANIMGDAGLLQNALLNLALNARDAMPTGGELSFATDLVDLDTAHAARLGGEVAPGPYLQITVSDTGQGMSPEVQSHLFEPFFSTKALGKGTGLGLASVYGTVKYHDGGIEVDSAVGRGTTFRIYLPRTAQMPAAAPEQVPALPVPRAAANTQVLIIDDEASVAAYVTDTLVALGYNVVNQQDGAAGLDYYRAHWQTISLVILDMNMPIMSGPEAFAGIRAINPDAKVFIISGHSAEGAIEDLLRQGAVGFLAKPFRPEVIANQVALFVSATPAP